MSLSDGLIREYISILLEDVDDWGDAAKKLTPRTKKKSFDVNQFLAGLSDTKADFKDLLLHFGSLPKLDKLLVALHFLGGKGTKVQINDFLQQNKLTMQSLDQLAYHHTEGLYAKVQEKYFKKDPKVSLEKSPIYLNDVGKLKAEKAVNMLTHYAQNSQNYDFKSALKGEEPEFVVIGDGTPKSGTDVIFQKGTQFISVIMNNQLRKKCHMASCVIIGDRAYADVWPGSDYFKAPAKDRKYLMKFGVKDGTKDSLNLELLQFKKPSSVEIAEVYYWSATEWMHKTSVEELESDVNVTVAYRPYEISMSKIAVPVISESGESMLIFARSYEKVQVVK